MRNRRRAAMGGQHMGMTCYGYVRVYPAWDGRGRRPAGLLTPHEPQASEVRQLFGRYDTGQWSTRRLAEDLNRRGVPSPEADMRRRAGKELDPAKRYEWSTSTVAGILRNPVYCGDVGYDRRAGRGHYIP